MFEGTIPTTSATTMRRSVSFDPRVFVKKTLHLNNYTGGEIRACWYNIREFSHIISEDAVCIVEY
jgi:hypothetical protein